MHQLFIKSKVLVQILIVLMTTQLSFTASANEALFAPSVNGKVVQFGTSPIYIRDAVIRVVLSGPDDYVAEKIYYAGEKIIWVINKTGGQMMPNGTYNYEITQSHRSTARQTTPIELEGRTSLVKRESGTLSVLEGKWVNPEVSEAAGSRDQVISDDLAIQGSLCVGVDCVNNESFDFDTIRLKENNLRIRFQDTSNSASFPSTDWELRANDTTNGGANKFAITDLTNNAEIFVVEGSAPANSLYVDDRGRVGFGTNSPVLDQHILSGNTPATRFEQDGSGGFPSQVWDLGGNETEFFLRDTTSAEVPFRVEPGADSDSLVINSDGNIEVGGTIINRRSSKRSSRVLSKTAVYQLPSLEAVEAYILNNNQLPGIKDRESDLMLLQLQMLEKIEELTLYTIEQEKRIKALEARLKEE